MATLVISLGGSLIVPKEIDTAFLKNFSAIIKKISKKNKIVIVTGGGATARRYIVSVRKKNLHEKFSSLVGIESTKLNAALVAAYLSRFHILPDSLEEVEKELKDHGVVVCGALGFTPNMTSDGDAAQIAAYLEADIFINLTNVDGLYDKNPRERGARLIKKISFKNFKKIADKIKYSAGQHFVLDQVAAGILSKVKIKTFIINGRNLKNFMNVLKGKVFIGTMIYD